MMTLVTLMTMKAMKETWKRRRSRSVAEARMRIGKTQFSSLHQLNQHRSQVHNYKQVLVGENVLFEKPSGKLAMKAGYFCPIPTCKYNIASSGRAKFFSTAKLLKQHYAKVREVFYHLRISSMTAKCSLGP